MTGIAADSDPLCVTWRRAIERKQLEPAGSKIVDIISYQSHNNLLAKLTGRYASSVEQRSCTYCRCKRTVKKLSTSSYGGEWLNKSNLWEDRPCAHRLAVGRGNSTDEGESNRAALVDIERYGVRTTICPVFDRQCCNVWLDATIYQVWG